MREDWIEAALGEVFETVTGNTPSKKDKDNYGSEIPFIKPPQINNNFLKTSAEFLSTKGKIKARILPLNSVLVTCIGNLGRIGINKAEVAFNQQINAIKPISGIEPKYTFYQAQSVSFRNQLEKLSTSTTVALVNKTSFNSVKFKIAPLPIQKAIVNKIEELFSSLDSGIADLKKAQDQLVIYRQAVLKKAFEGELTKEWREKQTNLPSNNELLELIKEERQKHYNQQLADWKEAVKVWEKNGKDGKKPVKPRFSAFNQIEHSTPSLKIPDSWVVVTPNNIADPQNYSVGIGPFGSNLKVSDYTGDGHPIIFVRHITKRDFSLNRKFTSNEKFHELRAHTVFPLDLLITKMGDPPGDCLIYPKNEIPGVITSDIIKFKVWDRFVSRKYIMYAVNSIQTKTQLGLITQGVAQKKISLGRFKTLKFPFTSVEEQHQIVQEIESRLSVCDKIEKDIADSLEKAQALRQSILKKAFEGTLLSEEEIAECKAHPDYVPASVLLARIKKKKNG